MDFAFTYQTKLGSFTFVERNGAITTLYPTEKLNLSSYQIKETPVLQQGICQLQEYLEGKRRVFALPLAPIGTPFQQREWAELQKIPYGTTLTYQEVAEKLGKPTAARAVGNANGKNPIFIMIPCHRVLGSNGSLTGFAGGIAMKETLLQLEGVNPLWKK